MARSDEVVLRLCQQVPVTTVLSVPALRALAAAGRGLVARGVLRGAGCAAEGAANRPETVALQNFSAHEPPR